jgi:hypothetical protein
LSKDYFTGPVIKLKDPSEKTNKIIKQLNDFYENCIKNVKNIDKKICKSGFNNIFNDLYTTDILNKIIFINKNEEEELKKNILKEKNKNILKNIRLIIENKPESKNKSGKEITKLIKDYIKNNKEDILKQIDNVNKNIIKQSGNSNEIIKLYGKIKNYFI